MKIEFDKKKKEWIELPSNSKEGIYIDRNLYGKLQNIRFIQKKGYDCPFIIDGGRREGKSILGMTCAWILSDCKLTINNFAIGSEDAKQKIKILPDRSILFVDEASAIFSSKDAMKKELKELIKILDVVGMKELIFILILPSFFDLIKPISVRFSKFLLHVYKSKDWERGRFGFFGEQKKKLLYIIGKKNFDSYAKPKADFIGKFVNFKVPFYEEYLRLKRRTLLSILDGDIQTIPEYLLIKFRKDIVKRNEESEEKLNRKQLSKLFGVSERTIWRDVKDIEENQEKNIQNQN